MKGDVLSCLCTFLSPKSKFSLYKKITKQRDNNNQEQVKEKHGKVACRQKKPYCSVWLVNICRVVMGPVPSSGYCLNNPYLNMRREMKTLHHYDSHVGLGPNTTLRKHHDHCGRRRRLKIDGGLGTRSHQARAFRLSGRKRYTGVQRGLSSNVRAVLWKRSGM